MNIADSNKDLFDESRMSFGEHLDELRKALFLSAVGVAIGCAVGLFFAPHVIELLNRPLVKAMGDYKLAHASNLLKEKKGYVPMELVPWLEKERFVPRTLRIDPAQLVNALKTVVPDLGTTIELDPYGFQATHFDADRLPNLCRQLAQEDQRGPQQTALWKTLTPIQQQTLTEIANQPDANDGDIETVMAIFNQVTRDEKLSQHVAFADLLSPVKKDWSSMFQKPKVKPLAQMNLTLTQSGDPNLRRRLNRALIAESVSAHMPPLRMNLISMEVWESNAFKPLSLKPTDGFFIWLKAGLVTGACLSFPWVFYCIWNFVAEGLYPAERKYVHYFLPISIGLFVAGVLLAYFFVFEPVLNFLFSFNAQMGIAPEMRINDWLSFVLMLPLGFGVAFQLPLVMLFLNRINIFTIDAYLAKWRIAVMCIFVLSMFLTPADPISMMLLAVPLTLLYFLGVAMCRYMPGYNPNPYGEV
jgi:sec-independent protein translocase protein TatC